MNIFLFPIALLFVAAGVVSFFVLLLHTASRASRGPTLSSDDEDFTRLQQMQQLPQTQQLQQWDQNNAPQDSWTDNAHHHAHSTAMQAQDEAIRAAEPASSMPAFDSAPAPCDCPSPAPSDCSSPAPGNSDGGCN